MMKKLTAVLALFALNCGTIIHQTTQEIPVKSDPPGANVTVACGEVENDPKAMTPTRVSVHRKPEFCQISLTKEGYERMDVTLGRTMSALYLGNILIGGIVGFIVDGVNGAMWNRKPGEIDVKLAPKADTTPATGN